MHFRITMTETHMRINSSVIALAAALGLTNSSVSRAQVADMGRVAVARVRDSSSAAGVSGSPDTTRALVVKEVHAGPPIALGAVIGALAGVAYTVVAVNHCETQPSSNKDMSGLCGLGFVTVGPAALGGGALIGGFVGWLVARSQREGAR